MALPDWLRTWLGAVPVAILAALLATELLVTDGHFVHAQGVPALIALLPVLAITALTRSLMGAVVAGMLTVALLRAVWV